MSSQGTTPDPADRPNGEGPRIIAASEILEVVRGQDSLRVISRLERNGHEAYLVGGCVRDLLVGRVPKDFDVATSAHPRQIRRLFPRNSHIIGRRFRLVHIRYGQDSIIETATFRAEPDGDDDSDDLLITEDNEYGSAGEDARRRDFTVNGLFLDPTRNRIIDYVGGLDDLEAGLLRTIGEPEVRMSEDPVRILRAIKFATRLGFRIEDRTWAAMCATAPELSRSAPPRVLEEILRLMRSGTALGAFRKLRRCGALRVVLPELDQFIGPAEHPSEKEHERAEALWRLLEALDADVHGGAEPSTAVCVALLYHDLVEGQLDESGGSTPELMQAAAAVIEPLAANSRLSRRDSSRARRIIVQQRTFTRPLGKRFRPRQFCLNEDFPDALELFRLRSAARGQGWDIYEGWVERRRQALSMPAEEVESERGRSRRGGRKRGRRSRRGRRPGSDAEAGRA